MKCEEARELFKKLYKEGNFAEIGRTFKELKGKELRCFESGAMELGDKDIDMLRERVKGLLLIAHGKEKPLNPVLIKKILLEGIAVYLVRHSSKTYIADSIIVRFRDGKQRTIKHRGTQRSEEDRTYEIYGALKTYILATRDT